MGVSIHYGAADTESEVIPLAGQQEVLDLWMPIIRKRGLDLLDYCMTAGLSIDADNYSQILEEVLIAQQEIESQIPFVEDPTNPVFRCKRLRDILLTHPPSKGYSVYIG
jgi:hypothetical protein